MTELLQRAFEAAQQLPPDEQNAIAARILEEIEDELAWERTLANSQDFLRELTEEARAKAQAGHVYDKGWDEL